MANGTQQQKSATEMSPVQLIDLLNEDLRRHLEAIMLCVNYSEMLGGNADRNIAGQLTKQLHSELQQALNSAERILLARRRTRNQSLCGPGIRQH